MARKSYKPEEIVSKLRQADVLLSQGQSVADAIRQIGVTNVTYYRWRQDVAKSYDEYAANPGIGIPANKIMSRLKATYQARKAKSKN